MQDLPKYETNKKFLLKKQIKVYVSSIFSIITSLNSYTNPPLYKHSEALLPK